MFRYTRPVRDVLVDAPHNERLTLLAIDRARARLLGPLNAVQILLLQAGVHVQVQLLILPLRRHGNICAEDGPDMVGWATICTLCIFQQYRAILPGTTETLTNY